MIRFRVTAKPCGTNASYRTGKGHWYKSDASKLWQSAVRLAAHRAMLGKDQLDGHVEVRLCWVFDSERPDLDGPIKGTLDALQGVCFANDRQVRRLIVDRDKATDGNPPGALVHVLPYAPGGEWIAAWEVA